MKNCPLCIFEFTYVTPVPEPACPTPSQLPKRVTKEGDQALTISPSVFPIKRLPCSSLHLLMHSFQDIRVLVDM